MRFEGPFAAKEEKWSLFRSEPEIAAAVNDEDKGYSINFNSIGE